MNYEPAGGSFESGLRSSNRWCLFTFIGHILAGDQINLMW